MMTDSPYGFGNDDIEPMPGKAGHKFLHDQAIDMAIRKTTSDYWRKGMIAGNVLGLGILPGDHYLIEEIRAEYRKIMACQ